MIVHFWEHLTTDLLFEYVRCAIGNAGGLLASRDDRRCVRINLRIEFTVDSQGRLFRKFDRLYWRPPNCESGKDMTQTCEHRNQTNQPQDTHHGIDFKRNLCDCVRW